MSAPALDVLALPLIVMTCERTCGGTLLRMAQRGLRTGILDLTQGEMGTRGSADDRAREAANAARILKASFRYALDIPDGRVENSWKQPAQNCPYHSRATSARADPSLLEGPAS